MRWKLLRRRLSVSAPRMIVRSHLPWPLRWAFAALVLGFSAAIALWAFELGKDIAGLDRDVEGELRAARAELQRLRDEQGRLQSVANTADSLLRAERASIETLQQQLRRLEAENLALRADLGFFEQLLPAQGEPLAVRALHAEALAPGQLRYQMLVMQSGKAPATFRGRYEVRLSGVLDGAEWSSALPEGSLPIEVGPYTRVEGLIDHPERAVVQRVQVRILGPDGQPRAAHAVAL